jgi:hypothetical protein
VGVLAARPLQARVLPLQLRLRLERAGFTLSFWDAPHAKWSERWQELRAFRHRHRHFEVPRSSARLFRWVERQRRKARFGRLAPERRRRLENLGFEWAPIDAAWQRKIRALKAYRARFGDCRVPQNWSENPSLGLWLANQRKRYAGGTLAPERVRELEKRGVEWEVSEALWEERFAAWLQYRRRTGTPNVPLRVDASLGRWVVKQRMARGKGLLLRHREQPLTEAGFVWVLAIAGK